MIGARPLRGRPVALCMLAAFVLAGVTALTYFVCDQYRFIGLVRAVRQSFAARQIEKAREPLRHWLALRPRAAEAHYYRAWEALALDQPDQAVQAIDQAGKLGFDPPLVNCLSAIYQARAGRIKDAAPVLEQAFGHQIEPRDMVAKELARIYLTTYQLSRAALAIERWRPLAPADPLPYLWRNEIASRYDVEPAIQVLNYRAALERDPNLDKARLGLAQELSKARRFDEADQVYLDYLKRNRQDASALIGLGQNAFLSGDLRGATQYFEAALQASPRQLDALKELALIELRLGRFQKACERYQLLTQIAPFDHEIRFSYAQALKLEGLEARSRVELAQANRLRQEHDQMMKFRYNLLRNPNDLDSRFQVARWLIEYGHQEEGLRWAQEIFRADPRHAPTHRVLADHYRRQGDSGLANYHLLMSSSP
jgi:tetratricopeptide (TPR) repeat protein